MSETRGSEPLKDSIISLDNATSTLQLRSVADGVLEGIEGGWNRTGETLRKDFISKRGPHFWITKGRNLGFDVLTIWRFFEGVKGDGITFITTKDQKEDFEGLMYFPREERKNIEHIEKKGKLIDDSWTVDSQRSIAGEDALPMVKEILRELLEEEKVQNAGSDQHV